MFASFCSYIPNKPSYESCPSKTGISHVNSLGRAFSSSFSKHFKNIIIYPFSKHFQILYMFAQIFKYFALFNHFLPLLFLLLKNVTHALSRTSPARSNFFLSYENSLQLLSTYLSFPCRSQCIPFALLTTD